MNIEYDLSSINIYKTLDIIDEIYNNDNISNDNISSNNIKNTILTNTSWA